MDLNKTGKYIAEKRKKKNLTQEQLGDYLNVNSKTVSKWERGICMPDISILPSLAKKLGTSIENIIYGNEKRTNRILERIYDFLKHFIKIYKKAIFFLLLIITCFAGIFYYYEKSSKFSVYDIYTSNKNFNVSGYIIYNTNKKVIILNNFTYNDIYIGTEKEIKINEIKIAIVYDNIDLYTKIYSLNNTFETKSINDLLNFINININSDNNKKIKPINRKNLNKLKIRIEYENKDGILKVNVIDLNLK